MLYCTVPSVLKNVILEAGGKLGGRMRTQTEGLQSGVLELGAQVLKTDDQQVLR